MSTWSLEQVRQVRSLFVRIDVDPQVWARGCTREVLRPKVSRKLITDAQALAVDLHPDDLVFKSKQPDGARQHIKMLCCWQPKTHTVRLSGGSPDGLVVEFADAPEEMMTVTVRDPLAHDPVANPHHTHPTAFDTGWTAYYLLNGWDETERRWVYAPQ